MSSDFRKRSRVAARPGWRLFQLTWHDLSTPPAAASAPDALVGVPDAVWAKVFPAAAKSIPPEAHEAIMRLPRTTPMDLLCGYLEQPGPHWVQGVAAMLCARLATAGQRGELVDGHGLFRVEDHLRTGRDLAPLPPVGMLSAAPRATDFWGLAELTGDLAVILRAKGSSIRSFAPAGVEVLMRLDDRAARRADPSFAASWRAALQGLNLVWMLPNTEVVSDEAMDLDVGDAGADVLAQFGLLIAAEPAGPAYGYGQALDDILDSCFDDDARALVRAVYEAGLPLPAADRPELAEVVIPDLAWPDLRIAVVHPEQTEARDIAAARADGWTVLLLPVKAGDLLTALRNATRPT